MKAFAEFLRLIHHDLVTRANRAILAAVAYWPSGKKVKLSRRKAKQLSIVKRLKSDREKVSVVE